MTYQIKDWDKYFENDRSRQREKCSFVCVPNKQSGMGFCRIMSEPDGAAIYGIWHMILGACSQQPRRNGWLTADGDSAGSPWLVDDLSLKFRRPEKEIQRALEVLMSEKVGWIVAHNSPPTNRAVTSDSPPGTLKEGKGMEGKGEKECARSRFSERPSFVEFFEYCKMHGLTAEWYAKDKWLAAESDNWKNKDNWTAYADRCRTWWESDGRPAEPPKGKNASKRSPENPRNFGMPSTAKQTSDRIVAELKARGGQ